MTTTSRKLELPEKMEVIRQNGQIVIVRRWRRGETIVVGALGAFVTWQIFNGFFFSYPSLDHAIRSMEKGLPVTAIIFLAFSLSGSWMMYFCLASLINRTRITLSAEGISVRHGPLPWPGNRHLARADLKQFYTKTNFERGALSNYRIQALLRDDRVVSVINGPGLSKQQAVYLEAALKQAFRTADAAPRDAMIADAGLTIRKAGSGLEIVKRWFDRDTIRKMVFSAIWLVFTGWMTWAWHTRFGTVPFWPLDSDRVGPVTLIQSMFLGLGVVLAYRAAAGWLNRTFVTVDRETISIRHGPLPWRGSMAIALPDIRELQLKQSSHGRRVSPGRSVHKFEVHAVLTDGRSRKLLGDFDMPAQAQQFKQEIEAYLVRKQPSSGALASPSPADGAGIQEAWENDMLQGRPSSHPIAGMPERSKRGQLRVIASFLGLLAMAGGVFLLASLWGLHQAGATVMSQVIRGLAAFFPLSIGFLLFAAANNLKGERVYLYLFWAAFVAGAILFLLLFIYGSRS